MLDPITALSVATSTIGLIRKCVDDSDAVFRHLKKYAGAIEDCRHHVRMEKEFGKSPLKKTVNKAKSATDQAFDIIIMEEKIRQHEQELYTFFSNNWAQSWGGRNGWLRFRKLRDEIRAKKESEEYSRIRRRQRLIYNSKLGSALGLLLMILFYLCWFLYNAIVESSK